MNVFDYIILDSIIQGISELHTDYKEGANTIQYSFHLYLSKYEICIASDVFDAGDSTRPDREAWLLRYRQVKEKIARLLNVADEERAAHHSAVNDCYYQLKEHIQTAFVALPADNPLINRVVERIHLETGRLKNLALKTC